MKIYQSYYVLTTVVLETFFLLEKSDQKKAFLVYANFLRVNKEIRRMASQIV